MLESGTVVVNLWTASGLEAVVQNESDMQLKCGGEGAKPLLQLEVTSTVAKVVSARLLLTFVSSRQ